MENTSFNYQPRDPQAQINWAEAASNLGNVLKEEARVRTEKKAAIDKDIRETQKIFAAGVPGESTSIREWGLNYAGVAEEQLDMLTTLLKSGQMSVSDYTINKQNLLDGTEEAFSLMENYQEVFAEKMARLQEQDPSKASQGLEGWIMENVEGFGDFNKTQLVVDPGTGKVMVGKKVLNKETGLMEISKNPEDLAPVSSLKHNIISQFNKYDVEKSTKAWTDNLGLIQSVVRETGSRTKAGQILTVIGKIPAQYDKEGRRIMNKIDAESEIAKKSGLSNEAIGAINDYIEAEDSWIDGQLSNPYNMTSIFTDYINETDGKSNSFTLNPEEAKENPNLILVERKGGTVVPIFDSRNPNAKKQKEDIRQYMKWAIRTKTSESSAIQTYSDYKAPQEWQYRAGKEKKQIQNTVSTWNEMGWADGSRKNVLANAFIGTPQAQSAGLTAITFDDDAGTVSFSYENSAKNTTKPMPSNQNDWSKLGSEIHGQQGKVAEYGNKGNSFNSSGFGNVSATREGKTNPNQEVNRIASSAKIDKENIANFATEMGGTIEGTGSSAVIINANSQQLPIKGASEEAIRNHMKNVTEEQAQGIVNRKRKGGGASKFNKKG